MLPNGWQEVRLENVAAEITVGHVGPMASEYVADGIPLNGVTHRLAHGRPRVVQAGYPPDKQEQATRTVLEQAEVLSQEWAVA